MKSHLNNKIVNALNICFTDTIREFNKILKKKQLPIYFWLSIALSKIINKDVILFIMTMTPYLSSNNNGSFLKIIQIINFIIKY